MKGRNIYAYIKNAFSLFAFNHTNSISKREIKPKM
jgi:hypothetical protein